jgi:thiol-disulfide isomerase/thioredoxin
MYTNLLNRSFFLIAAFIAVGFLSSVSTPLSGEEIAEFDALIDKIFSGEIKDENIFNEKLEHARKLGASTQLLTEARMLFHIVNQDYEGLSSYLPEIDKESNNWAPDESKIFRDTESYQGMRSAIHAYDAQTKNDIDAFETYSKNAFWLDPRLAPLLTTWIQDHRRVSVMSNIQVPFDMNIQHSNGDTTTLGSLVKEKKALLLDFWATWCGPCIALMSALAEKAEILEPQGILVAGMNTESVSKAEQFRKEKKINITWLVEPDKNPLSQLFMIDSIPRMVLIDNEGHVLFNGHPNDPSLHDALAKLEVTL